LKTRSKVEWNDDVPIVDRASVIDLDSVWIIVCFAQLCAKTAHSPAALSIICRV
jgi:hypothetical protein